MVDLPSPRLRVNYAYVIAVQFCGKAVVGGG